MFRAAVKPARPAPTTTTSAVLRTVAPARGALERDPEALDQGGGAVLVDPRGDLDGVEPPRAQREVAQRVHGSRHRPAALRILGEPVADARRGMLQVDGVKADHADDA